MPSENVWVYFLFLLLFRNNKTLCPAHRVGSTLKIEVKDVEQSYRILVRKNPGHFPWQTQGGRATDPKMGLWRRENHVVPHPPTPSLLSCGTRGIILLWSYRLPSADGGLHLLHPFGSVWCFKERCFLGVSFQKVEGNGAHAAHQCVYVHMHMCVYEKAYLGVLADTLKIIIIGSTNYYSNIAVAALQPQFSLDCHHIIFKQITKAF